MTELITTALDADVPRRPRTPFGLSNFADEFVAWLVPVFIVTLWQAACSLDLLSYAVLPSPAAVLAAGWHLTLSGDLPRNVEISFLRAISGLAVGGGIVLCLASPMACRRLAIASPTRLCR